MVWQNQQLPTKTGWFKMEWSRPKHIFPWGRGKDLIFVLYVDDLLVIGNHESKIKWLIQQLEHTFEVSNLGKLQLYFNVEFISLRNGIFMCQHTYILRFYKSLGWSIVMLQWRFYQRGSKWGRKKIPSLLICWRFGELLVNWSNQY